MYKFNKFWWGPVYLLLFVHLFIACFGVIHKNSLPIPRRQWFCPMFSFKSLVVLALTFKCLIHFELIFLWRMWGTYTFLYVKSVQLHSFICGYPVVPVPFVEMFILSLFHPWFWHPCLGTPVENQLTTDTWVCFWTLSQWSICLFFSAPLLDYCCFLVSFETEKCDSSNFVLQIFSRLFWLFFGSLQFPYEF